MDLITGFMPPAGDGGQGGSPVMLIVMMVGMFAIMYFLIIRPQQKRQKEHKAMLEAIKDNFNEEQYQEKIRQKRKEFIRIKTTDSYSKEAKDDAQKRFNKTEFVFKRKSNAGRPAKNPYDGLKQTEL